MAGNQTSASCEPTELPTVTLQLDHRDTIKCGPHYKLWSISMFLNGNRWMVSMSLTDVASQPLLVDVSFECATVEVPMCHSEICSSSKTVQIFIKRKLAAISQDQESKPHKSVWFLAGGPGASSANLEMAMLEMNALTKNSVDVYTMDHRGTGRSSYLECVAAQAMTTGSPGGTDISLEELPYCVKNALHQMDGQTAAFSVTSAARDVLYLLDELENDEENNGLGEVYLYGTSYGTYLAERVMHLAPPQVKGYILDGVVSEAGPDADKRLFFSHWDRNILAPTGRFFYLCAEQKGKCPLDLDVADDEDVSDAVLDIYDDIDQTKKACALELMLLTGMDTPSEVLRPFLGLLVRDPSVRVLVPSILARFQRCSSKDQQELELVMGPLLNLMIQQAEGAAFLAGNADKLKTTGPLGISLDSSIGLRLASTATGSIDQLVYLLISYSELWAKPSPNETELEEFYFDGVFSLGSASLTQYCRLSGNLDSDPTCNQVAHDPERTGIVNTSFTYAFDEFSNQTAPVPPNASLLVINGGLDFQTPREFGRHQFDSSDLVDPETSRKMLLEFDFGGHVCGLSATTADDETMCGPDIVSSFIINSGDPEAIDTSCMDELPELQLTDDFFSMLVESIF